MLLFRVENQKYFGHIFISVLMYLFHWSVYLFWLNLQTITTVVVQLQIINYCPIRVLLTSTRLMLHQSTVKTGFKLILANCQFKQDKDIILPHTGVYVTAPPKPKMTEVWFHRTVSRGRCLCLCVTCATWSLFAKPGSLASIYVLQRS